MSKAKINKLQSEIDDLHEALNSPGLPDDEKEVISEEISEIEKQIKALEKKTAKPKDKKAGKKEKRKRPGRPPKDGVKRRPTPFEKKLEECRETIRRHRESKPRKEPVRHTRPKRLSDLMAKVFNLIAEANSNNAELLDRAQKDISAFHDKISKTYLGSEKPISPVSKEKMEKKIEKADAA